MICGALALVVVAVMGCAIAGIGTGEAPAACEPSASTAAVANAKRRIAAGGATVQRGKALFADHGCGRCHSIAFIATASGGKGEGGGESTQAGDGGGGTGRGGQRGHGGGSRGD